MDLGRFFGRDGFVSALRTKFRSRDLFFHDGSNMRRVHVSAKVQVAGATAGVTTLTLALLSIAQLAVSAPAVAGAMSAAVSRDVAVARMSAKVASMEAEMATIRAAAADHAKRLEARQAMLDAVVTGKGVMPASMSATSAPASPILGAVLAPLASAEGHQNMLAGRLATVTDARYQATASALGRLGINASRFHQVSGDMGGPYEPMPSASSTPTVKGQPDPAFRALFQSWKRLEQLQQGIVAIPSQRPVDAVTFTSGFGVRSDPFRGGAAMHAGVDIPGPMGTPIYATADGVVARGEWANGYGNLVELDHGKGIQTRYGHLSAILVQPGMRVTRGQLIARMGSTGRSTGSHLHYEVRLDGHAVNPMPFLQSANYLVAMQTRGNLAVGGPKGE
jgi:murein DD-endopeptidase MepM/ murein hydrolase activator NlpD